MSQIKTNTAALQELLNTATNLPEPVDTSDATATSSKILSGYTAYVKDKLIAGTIPNRTASDLSVNEATVTVPAGNYADDVSKSVHNNGSISKTIDGVNTKTVSIPAGYTSGGTVNLDNTIDNAVADAIAALVEKEVEVPDGTDVTGLASLIAAIESGGGCVAEGTFVPNGTIDTPYTIEHGLGVTPRLFVLYSIKTQEYSSYVLVGVIYQCTHYNSGDKLDNHVYADSGYEGAKRLEASSGSTLTAENVVIRFDRMNGYGLGYGWFAIA